MQYHLAIKMHMQATLLRIEDFMKMGHDSLMRPSKIFTESYGLACTKTGKIFAIQKNCGNLNSEIEEDVATINDLNSHV